MYLNVNLTPPSTAEGSSMNTPKTPEILNSLISLSSTPFLRSFEQNTPQKDSSQSSLSPTSSASTPSEEQAESFPARTRSKRRNISTSPTDSGPACIKDTKLALVKESLKVQLKHKLKACGFRPEDATETKVMKEELSQEDEERRRRRRERNKVAATKCRNKKKQQAVSLLNESQTVNQQNKQLKSEIERLESVKYDLQRILEDPSHTATCCHAKDSPELPSKCLSEITVTQHEGEKELPPSIAELDRHGLRPDPPISLSSDSYISPSNQDHSHMCQTKQHPTMQGMFAVESSYVSSKCSSSGSALRYHPYRRPSKKVSEFVGTLPNQVQCREETVCSVAPTYSKDSLSMSYPTHPFTSSSVNQEVEEGQERTPAIPELLQVAFPSYQYSSDFPSSYEQLDARSSQSFPSPGFSFGSYYPPSTY